MKCSNKRFNKCKKGFKISDVILIEWLQFNSSGFDEIFIACNADRIKLLHYLLLDFHLSILYLFYATLHSEATVNAWKINFYFNAKSHFYGIVLVVNCSFENHLFTYISTYDNRHIQHTLKSINVLVSVWQ